jgi:hypothetical protein
MFDAQEDLVEKTVEADNLPPTEISSNFPSAAVKTKLQIV